VRLRDTLLDRLLKVIARGVILRVETLPPISFMQGTHRSGVKASNAGQDSAATVTLA
jgi:hypothetical protein